MRNDKLEKIRSEIDSVDEKIIGLFGERQEIARKIGEIKKTLNLEIVDEKRKEIVFAKRLQLAQEKGLPEKDVEDLFKLLHEKSVNVQKNV